jgi:hypothetical protein
MRIFLSGFILIFFLGCSGKINLTDYRPAYVPKNPLAPKHFSSSVKKVSIVKFPKYYFKNLELSKTATYTLKSLLNSSKFVKVIRIIPANKIKDEIKAAEIARETESYIGADYLIKGKILNVTYNALYHRGFYYYVKTKHGKIRKYSPPYYSYTACSQINITATSLKTLNDEYDSTFEKCAYYSSNLAFRKFYPSLVIKALNKTVKSAYESLKKFFAPKGYIYEVRKNGGDLIAKITLGKNQGMREGLKLDIYTVKKDPVTGEIEKYKIGEGEVSNIIFDNSCWIKVDLEDNARLEIGDVARPNFETSFWDMF